MYQKPVMLEQASIAEGVYAASGCYTATATLKQMPETGRATYCFQINGVHRATHTVDAQTLTITFNQPVGYQSSQGTLVSGDGTATLVIAYRYHNNPTDNIGLGDLYVTADSGLAVTAVSITDDAEHF